MGSTDDSVAGKSDRMALSELILLQREISQLADRMAQAERAELAKGTEWSPSVDVFSCKDRVAVVVELPGLNAEAIDVAYRDGAVVVSGERRRLRSGSFLCMERLIGRFSRTIPLDEPVDHGRAEAQMVDGVLTISLPRLDDRRGRETRISIKKGKRR